MRLKSLIEKIMLINKTVDYLNNREKTVYGEYYQKKDFKSINELEKILNNSIRCTQNQELKTGLEIISILISHKNKNIRFAALGKVYPLINDEYTQKLIIKELKNVSDNESRSNQGYADDSLDLIAKEVYKLEIFDKTFNVLAKLINVFKDTSNHINNKIILYFEESDDENFIKPEKMSCLYILGSKSNERDSLQKLVDFYAGTFMEKGNLLRLINLLDSNDPNVRKMGFDALIEVLEVVLTRSNEKNFIKPLTDSP